MDIKDCFYIGYISKTKGLKGEIQLFFEFEDYKDLQLDVLFIEIENKLVPYFIEHIKVHDNQTAFIFLDDVDHIDKAQPLIRKKVYLSSDKIPQRDPDDFRITDLKGFEVHDEAFGLLGEITEIHEFPQQHIAVVLYRSKELMFPLIDAIILETQRENKLLKVNLPEGLVDLYVD